ncbi:phosphogluconate dehydrogenase (decarboxylating) [Gleimia coleocanis DSM 15436]|uniref:6-phosphogluconate dehydrogenase, decarboxylating n=1 Tax=Gleimia coleocanis DSM 15436 TaxID=525245 RepID=C0VXY4_9ACTO|nr:NADP-dependent phosphogluconate dehydrogenase [Gleimia coleocanis]EEH64287.1 phosphogluconate dehydrogenase (decarboxylating) [Gleimia coleocanis DSM 15436]
MSFNSPQPATADIGVYGMGVMGSNLARNLARNGYRTAVGNRSVERTADFMGKHGEEAVFVPSHNMAEFISSLEPPRVGIIMVQAGAATDAVMESMAEHMEAGDIIVDCGNSLFSDTVRREAWCSARGLHFVGAGVSGGEEGALWGPSIMPGGTPESYDRLGPMFEAISAKVDGEPCCTHVGTDGAGHFVKMVHNGIEYADMQVIAEAYDLLKQRLGLSAGEIAEIFAAWNETELGSYLIEITAEVLRQVDAETGTPLVDLIVDRASQKGTGKWTVQNALDLAVPVTAIAEATMARGASSATEQRQAARTFAGHTANDEITNKEAFIEDVRQALYASKIVAYSQGFDQITEAAKTYGWDINRANVARIWRGGCIIRAVFLGDITEAYERNSELPLLMADENFAAKIDAAVPAWRRVVADAVLHGVPTPVFSSSLVYFDMLRAKRLPAALIQGQRDFFGAHTYQRTDKEGTFHTFWAEPGRPEEEA